MLRIERQTKQFTLLGQPSCTEASITERYDLEEFIFNSRDEFCRELGQELFILGKEVKPSEFVQDRIDLLALDRAGTTVIIELKRGANRLQLLQAIAYAGMISKWKPDDFFALLSAEQAEQLTNFLDVEREDINRGQRLILVAEAYDYEVLVGAEWLHGDPYGVDILCARISLANDQESGAEYLSFTPVFPAPELAHQAVPRRGIASQSGQWSDWQSALANVTNKDVVEYFTIQLRGNRENYLRDRKLFYRVDGKRRFLIAAVTRHARCYQFGRFEGDVDFWKQRISDPGSVREVGATNVRFLLSTAGDFKAFDAATVQLKNAEWKDLTTEIEDTGVEDLGSTEASTTD